MKLAHLMVFVPDLERARAFYSGVLGFPVRAEGERHLVFGQDGAGLVAFQCDRSGAVGDYAREGRAVFVFGVPSVEEDHEEAEEPDEDEGRGQRRRRRGRDH